METSCEQSTANPARRIDHDTFRRVMGRFASGVTIITTRHAGIDYGLTATAVSPLSLDPPMLLICVNRAANTRQAIAAAQWFAVNILQDHQGELARQFARSDPDKFQGIHILRGEHGLPLFPDTLASIECQVTEEISAGTHSMFLARVEGPGSQMAGRSPTFVAEWAASPMCK
ncbi:flavin reductase [Reticulibacter mediterranei]|uniref:Flavin reductase n=1 Tax=Reticulibacter mediterranei TaxID=2778369 RepID=A0A8J3N9H7_9CHLR|nr:flavin reductase family protein [Reticulibacter mediterranei]GHO99347.1 flavin reductase [Reticulibacter mediterranei]